MAHSSLRFGIGRFTTEEEIDFVVKKIVGTVNWLREMRFVTYLSPFPAHAELVYWQASHPFSLSQPALGVAPGGYRPLDDRLVAVAALGSPFCPRCSFLCLYMRLLEIGDGTRSSSGKDSDKMDGYVDFFAPAS